MCDLSERAPFAVRTTAAPQFRRTMLLRLRGREGRILEEALAQIASHGIAIRLLQLQDADDSAEARISPDEVREGRLRDLLT